MQQLPKDFQAGTWFSAAGSAILADAHGFLLPWNHYLFFWLLLHSSQIYCKYLISYTKSLKCFPEQILIKNIWCLNMVKKQSLKTWNPRLIVWHIHLLFNYYPLCPHTSLILPSIKGSLISSSTLMSSLRKLLTLFLILNKQQQTNRILSGYCIILLSNFCFYRQNDFVLRCHFLPTCPSTLKNVVLRLWSYSPMPRVILSLLFYLIIWMQDKCASYCKNLLFIHTQGIIMHWRKKQCAVYKIASITYLWLISMFLRCKLNKTMVMLNIKSSLHLLL